MDQGLHWQDLYTELLRVESRLEYCDYSSTTAIIVDEKSIWVRRAIRNSRTDLKIMKDKRKVYVGMR